MTSTFFVARPGDSQRHGPFSREELLEGLSSGRFTATDLTWETGTKDWIPLASFLMPPLPEASPSIPPGMPPLPGETLPPPPPWEGQGSTDPYPSPPPPPYHTVQKAPWSPWGLISFILALLGGGGVAWMLLLLWDKYPAYRQPLLTEDLVGWITAACGLLVLLVASPVLSTRRAVRGKAWGAVAAVFGTILLLGGLGGGILSHKWAEFRYEEEETSAVKDIAEIGRYCRNFAEANGGRYPNSIAELRQSKDANIWISTFYDTPKAPRTLRITPGLDQRSPADTVLLSDSWSSGRGRRAVYKVGGRAESTSVDPHGVSYAPTTVAPKPVSPPPVSPAPVVPAPIASSGPDLSSPQKTLEALFVAGKAGDVAAFRRVMTPAGFAREAAIATPEKLRREFGNTTYSVLTVGPVEVGADGVERVQLRLAINENGRAGQSSAKFEKRGQEWLLASF